jgi:hypothetical protein
MVNEQNTVQEVATEQDILQIIATEQGAIQIILCINNNNTEQGTI